MINSQKLLNTSQSTDTKSAQPTQSFFAKANVKLVSIKNILAGTLAVEKTKLQQKKARELQERREKTEERLETKPGAEKDRGLTNRIPRVGGMGVLGWFKNFIGSILLGFLLTKLLGARSFLEGFLKTMNNVSSFLANFGMALVNGFATFVNAGYEAYDATKGFLKDLGGEDLEKLFEGFMDKVSMLVDALIIASLIKGSGDFGPGRRRRRRGPDFPDPRGPRGPRGPGPKTPKPKRPTGERKPKTKPEGRRPRFDISRLIQLAAAVGGAVGLGVLTRGKGRALLRLLSRAGVRVPSKVLEKTVEQSIPTRVRGRRVKINMEEIMGIGRSPRQIKKEMLEKLERERVVAGGDGGTRAGGGGGRSGGGTTTATGPGSGGTKGPSGADLNKMFTKEAFKRLPRNQRVDYLMNRLINEGGSVPTFRRALYEAYKKGLIDENDFDYFRKMRNKEILNAAEDIRRNPIGPGAVFRSEERKFQREYNRLLDLKDNPRKRNILGRLTGKYKFLDKMDVFELRDYVRNRINDEALDKLVRPDRFGGIKRRLEPLTDRVLFGIDSAKDAAKKVRDVAGGLTRPIGSVGRSVVEGVEETAKAGLQSTKGIFRAARGALRKVPLKIPILFGLLDFALAYLAGDPVGRAAFSAIGAGLVGAVATAIGSALPGIGNIILGAIGGTVGAMAGEALYDFFFTGQTPTVRNEALTEEEREMLTGGVDPDLLPKPTTPNPSFDPSLHGTPPDGIPYADDPSQQPGLNQDVPFDSDFLNQDAEGLTDKQREAIDKNLRSFNFNKGKDILAAYNNLRNFTSYENPLGTNTFIISRNEINSSSPPSLSMPNSGSPTQVALIDPGRSLMYKLS